MNMREINKLVKSDAEVDEKLIDAIIAAGCHEMIKNETFSPSKQELKKVAVSKELDSRMEKLFDQFEDEDRLKRKQERRDKTKSALLKICAGFVLVFFLSAITVVSSEAARVKVLNTYIKVFETKTDFLVTDAKEQIVTGSGWEQFGYMPEGFELVEEFDGEGLYVARFEEKNGKYIEMEIATGGASSIDSENAEIVEKSLGGRDCYIARKSGKMIVVFMVDEKVYTIISNIDDINEMEKIIENIK